MKGNKEKIEFWLHENQKKALKLISDETGYSVSELMRRGVEYIIRDLMPEFNPLKHRDVPFRKDAENVED